VTRESDADDCYLLFILSGVSLTLGSSGGGKETAASGSLGCDSSLIVLMNMVGQKHSSAGATVVCSFWV
jgi:hypothetical protein